MLRHSRKPAHAGGAPLFPADHSCVIAACRASFTTPAERAPGSQHAATLGLGALDLYGHAGVQTPRFLASWANAVASDRAARLNRAGRVVRRTATLSTRCKRWCQAKGVRAPPTPGCYRRKM